MKIRYPYGSKERLFEMVQGVNGVNLSEGNQEILDFLKIIRADYPDDDQTYSKFLNLAKRKGIEVAKQEYENKYSPTAIKGKEKADKQHQKTIANLEKHNQLASKYQGIIQLIQHFMQTHCLYDMLLSVFQRGHPSQGLLNMIVNKKYANLFNREIKDMNAFERKYLWHDNNLIPLESIDLMEYKPKGWEKEYGEKFGLTLSIKNYIKAGMFKGSQIDAEDFIYFNVMLDPDLDSQLMRSAAQKNVGSDIKFAKLEALAKRYNRRMLIANEFAEFLTNFLNIYNKSDKSHYEIALSRLNEQILPKEKKEEVINDFIKFVVEKLSLTELPIVSLSYDETEASDMKSFGKYTPETNELKIIVINRNLADILRTIAHELIHHAQRLKGVLKPDSNDTGSEHENEANALAGVFMREYGKLNPIIFE